MKKTLCLYFQVHQPDRLRRYRFFDIGKDHVYYDEFSNRNILCKVAERCYLPTNKLMLELIKKHNGAFRISYSISGTVLEQFEKYMPEVLDSFKALAKTGCVEFIGETYAHSLAVLSDPKEFEEQVKMHSDAIERYFGQRPKTFRNTELVYSDEIGNKVAKMGFTTMLTEGAKHVLGWKSPNYVYTNAISPKLKILLRNFRLSDDIAFRFSDKGWSEYPLTTEKYITWLNKVDKKDEVVNLFMDYETFGEHQWEMSGIFDFLRYLPNKVLSQTDYEFLTPSETTKKHQPIAPIKVPFAISWADEERDLTAWLGNELQNEAFNKLYALGKSVKATNDKALLKDWRSLQNSDHLYYMSTKWFSDGDVHKYFNPYDTPYDAFINYMNVLSDFTLRVNKKLEGNVAAPSEKSIDLKAASKKKQQSWQRKNQLQKNQQQKKQLLLRKQLLQRRLPLQRRQRLRSL
jgi:alpha-amylase